MPRIYFVIGFMCFSLALGKASALLPIYHYAFTTYSCAIAELIAGTDTELYTKTDLRFMEGCYKVYKHMLQLEQNSNLLFKFNASVQNTMYFDIVDFEGLVPLQTSYYKGTVFQQWFC